MIMIKFSGTLTSILSPEFENYVIQLDPNAIAKIEQFIIIPFYRMQNLRSESISTFLTVAELMSDRVRLEYEAFHFPYLIVSSLHHDSFPIATIN